MTFQDLQLDAPLLRAVKEAGYARPTPIQQKAIPPVLAGRDLLGCAQTGTGKTAAFALPILQRLAAAPIPQGKGRLPRALVLTPTRELALQIEESFVLYAKHLKLRSAVIYGGVGQAPQVQQLKAGVDILTATPGRLNDLIGQGYIKLSAIEVFVLDEADRMLDMGFVNDVKKVIAHLPAQRQTLLFSATMPGEIVQLANSLLKDPVKVFVTPPATTVQAIAQQLYGVEKADKRKLLAQLLQAGDVQSALVFTRTKHGADRVVRDLKRDGVAAAAIHGNKSQTARQTALARLKKGEIQALVATDIAARGLDINELSHVFNYDLPNIPETYVHRIGRTGRAGHGGIAVSFCTLDEYPYLLDIEKLIGFALPRAEDHPWHLPLPTGAAPQKGQAPKAAGNAARTKQKAAAPAAKNQQKPAAKAQEKPAAQATAAAKAPAAKQKAAGSAGNTAPQKGRGRAPMPPPEAPAQGGARNIVTKSPPWADTAAADAAAPQEGDEAMSQNNRRRRRKKPAGQGQSGGEQPQKQAAPAPQKQEQKQPAKNQGGQRQGKGRQQKQERDALAIPKDERGVFAFTEEELAEDTSLRLIKDKPDGDDTKYASFEDYLKDR